LQGIVGSIEAGTVTEVRRASQRSVESVDPRVVRALDDRARDARTGRQQLVPSVTTDIEEAPKVALRAPHEEYAFGPDADRSSVSRDGKIDRAADTDPRALEEVGLFPFEDL
jgi:hypothetical protein